MKVVISVHHRFELWEPPQWFVQRLRADFPADSFLQTSSYKEQAAMLADADAAIAFSIREEDFSRATRLKWVHSPAAAVHQLMFPALVASDVVVTNSRDVHGPSLRNTRWPY